MRYKGLQCEKCSDMFTENDDVVVCPVCGAPHHRSCWQQTGLCAHETEHAQGYQWIMPELPKEAQEQEKTKPYSNEFMLKNGESIIVCPSCGAMNCENDVYCMRCGAPLKETPNNGTGGYFGANGPAFGQEFQNANYDNNRQRMYADFNRFGGLEPGAEIDGIPVSEYSDYIGGKAPGKIIRKIAVMERFGKQFSWCWPAVFIGPVWFFWRKMKKEGIIFSVILLALCSLSGILQVSAPLERFYNETFDAFTQTISGSISREELQTKIEESANIYEYSELSNEEKRNAAISSVLYYMAEPGLSIVCALYAMYFYRKKTKAAIMDIRGKCSSMEEYRNTLHVEGGTSVGWAVFGALLFITAHLCMSYLPLIIILFR